MGIVTAVARRLRTALVIGPLLLVLAGATADAYVNQNPYSVHLGTSASKTSCQSTVSVTATVRSADTGALVAGQVVKWDVKVAVTQGDSVTPKTSVTGEDGKAHTTLRFGNAAGQRTVRATIIAKWPATIDVKCTGPVDVPATPTAKPPTSSPSSTPIPATPTPATPTPTVSPSPGGSAPATPGPSPTTAASAPVETPSASAASPAPTSAAATDQPSSAGASSTGTDPLPLMLGVVLILALGGFGLALRAARR